MSITHKCKAMALDNNIQEHHMSNPATGILWFIASGISMILGYIDWHGLLAFVKEISPLFTIASGIMAIRHFYFSTKKIKK